ncbi:hypothetical protein P8C59_006845 [Phyllachora maydis]|uniref:Nucleoporin SEH1 n=1 Tax=Phyllachora maydis TaxID=1825666 RepID=A0AAD9MEY5_9PEZI|nr:hypothetical protein P8C59_006845 [Phyllachora maydis]
MSRLLSDPPPIDSPSNFGLVPKHGHLDLVQASAFNSYGDRCATGSVDGKIRVFNRHKDGVWRLCDTWTAHGGEILELQWLPPTIYPNLLASLGIEGRFKLWAEDPSAALGRRFSNASAATPSAAAAAAAASSFSSQQSSASYHRETHPKAAFETRSPRSPYRSFSMRHCSDTRHTYLALLAADGCLTVYENEQTENLGEWAHVDEFNVFNSLGGAVGSGAHVASGTLGAGNTGTGGIGNSSGSSGGGGGGGGGGGAVVAAATAAAAAAAAGSSGGGSAGLGRSDSGTARRPARGEETSFRVRFDPNPDVCYTAQRAGVPGDALGLVVAAMDTVRVYRTRNTVSAALGLATPSREFYLAVDVPAGAHRGLVRDVAWAPGNIRGYDVVATACQDGYVRVFRVETPLDPDPDPDLNLDLDLDLDPIAPQQQGGRIRRRDWSRGAVTAAAKAHLDQQKWAARPDADEDPRRAAAAVAQPKSGIRAGLDQSRSSTDRTLCGQPGQIRHVVAEISKLDSHRTPVWRVGFDDDGQILGSVGDEGKLMCYRQTPAGSWAKSSEVSMIQTKAAAAASS